MNHAVKYTDRHGTTLTSPTFWSFDLAAQYAKNVKDGVVVEVESAPVKPIMVTQCRPGSREDVRSATKAYFFASLAMEDPTLTAEHHAAERKKDVDEGRVMDEDETEHVDDLEF